MGVGANDAGAAPLASLPKELRSLLAGGMAGMLAKSVVAPFDRIKILYQVTSAHFRLRDVPRVAKSIVEKEGWAALWKGNSATMLRVFPYSGIQFMVFDYCKVHFLSEKRKRTLDEGYGASELGGNGSRSMENGSSSGSRVKRTATSISHRGTISREEAGAANKRDGLTPIESLVSGMIAGAISVICTYPLDMARVQLAVLRKKKTPKLTPPNFKAGAEIMDAKRPRKGMGYVLSKSFQNGGVQGLYRGIAPTMLGILPYAGAAFTINEQAKRRLTIMTGREPTTVERLQCGALSGLFAQTLAYPLEVTRRRMQTIGIVPTSGSDSAAVNFAGVSRVNRQSSQRQQQQQLNQAQRMARHQRPPSMVTTMRNLFEEQGVRGFYKGVSMNWAKGPVAFSISFTAFDTIQGWIEESAGEGIEREQRARLSIQRRMTNNDDD